MSEDPNTVTMILTFHRDTLELDIDAPEVNLDFALAMLERAKRLMDDQHAIAKAQAISASVREGAINADRARRVLSNLKM